MEARAAILQSVEKLRAVSTVRGTGGSVGGIPGQMESNSGATAEEWQRKDGDKVGFRLIEGGLLIH